MGSVSRLFGRWFAGKGAKPQRPRSAPEPPGADAPPAAAGAPAHPSAWDATQRRAENCVPAGAGGQPDSPAAAGGEPDAGEPASGSAQEWGAQASPAVGAFVDSFFDDLDAPATSSPDPAGEVQPAAVAQEPPSLESESPETREMFGAIAATYVRPVRQFLTRLHNGPVSTDWLEICLPAVAMVGRSARMMGFASLLPSLDRFEALLREAGDNEAVVDGANRQALIAAFADLAAALPEAFAFQEQEDQRDTVIVHCLLRQVPDVGKVTLDKIFGAGVTTVEMLERANPGDLTQTTGVSSRLSERICQAVARYCVERDARQGFDSPTLWLDALEPLLADLAAHHAGFLEQKGHAAQDAQARRIHRKAREIASLRLWILLAEMGEVHLVDELQKLSFENRIQRLRDFTAALAGHGLPGAEPTG